jgi:cyclopropane fatty-acyl-phospholipid synthase-like methyltransferase
MYWEKRYLNEKQIWGQKPSELAEAAVRYMQENRSSSERLLIADIGCGYGRDAIYLSQALKSQVLGVDRSENAIRLAMESLAKVPDAKVRFQRVDFRDLDEQRFDVVFTRNIYQLLKYSERAEFREMVNRTLKRQGLLFLMTLSTRDPQHYGKGTPVPDEVDSFQDTTFLHLCTKEELVNDFSFLKIRELYEHEFDEERTTTPHHHISWIMVAEKTTFHGPGTDEDQAIKP